VRESVCDRGCEAARAYVSGAVFGARHEVGARKRVCGSVHRVSVHRVSVHRVSVHRVSVHRVSVHSVSVHRVSVHRVSVHRCVPRRLRTFVVCALERKALASAASRCTSQGPLSTG
jgi:hypothetical protein